MTATWFVRGGGKVYGPIDAAKLKQLVADGKINQQTDVAQNNAGPWVPAGKVKGLFPVSVSMPPLPVAQPASNPPTAKHVPPAAAESPAIASQSSSKPSGPESFRNWYRRTVGSWNVALQIVAWMFGGYVFIPLWWAFSGNAPLLKIGMWIGGGFAVLLALTLVMEVVDPEGMKKSREEAAKMAEERQQRAGERKAEADASKGSQNRVVQHALMTGFLMAKGGAIKPNSEQLDALARRAANELGDEGGLGFKMQWKGAFWMGWNKGD